VVSGSKQKKKFHDQFWFAAAYLIGLGQRLSLLIATNLRHSKLLMKILVTVNFKIIEYTSKIKKSIYYSFFHM
jgi:hypothetical protein